MLLLSYFLIVSLSPTACLRAACASISGVLCGLFALTKRSLAYRLLPHVTMLPAGAVVVHHVADVGLTIPSLNSVRVIRTFSLPASFSTNKACFSKPVRAVQMLEKMFKPHGSLRVHFTPRVPACTSSIHILSVRVSRCLGLS